MSPAHTSVTFFLQMFVILGACRLVGGVARRWGQPHVVGEMIAGVLLGPSLFGVLFPDLQRHIFPADSLTVLAAVAQLGVGLYMFLVGLDFNTDALRARARSAAAVSVSGMVVPFALGAWLAVWLVKIPGLFSAATPPFVAVLFLGAAMAITAFPVLARILEEYGLTRSALGTLALTAGAVSDMGAWCVLAIVIASVGGETAGAIKAIAGGVAFAAVTLTIGRRLLAALEMAAERAGRLTLTLLGTVLTLFALAAWISDAIGLHAVFGGFLLGVAMPRGLLSRELQRQLGPFTVVFLVPVFFTFSGLNTRLDIINDRVLLAVAAAVLVTACAGKGVGCWAAARLSGQDSRTAVAIGALMNARGMMELIVLGIGLQHGIIRPALYSVMVLMTIVTTLMASPVLERVYVRHQKLFAGSEGVG